jgi:subtilisin family serine protease
VAAPGTQILSTWIYPSWNGGTQYYTRLTGTSMAAPHVAGAAALAIAASGGTLSNAQVANLLVATSTPLPALQGKVVANGVINLDKLLLRATRYGVQARAG